MITFFVPGRPQAQGSKVKGRWGNIREDNSELGPWRERVSLAAYQEVGLDTSPDGEDQQVLIAGPIAVGLEFVLYRPKGLSDKKPTPPATKKPDIDKMERAILDALTHVLWTDDAQVTHVFKYKRTAEPGESPGVRIWVEGIGE